MSDTSGLTREQLNTVAEKIIGTFGPVEKALRDLNIAANAEFVGWDLINEGILTDCSECGVWERPADLESGVCPNCAEDWEEDWGEDDDDWDDQDYLDNDTGFLDDDFEDDDLYEEDFRDYVFDELDDEDDI